MSMLRILLLTLLAVLPIAAAAAPLSGTKSVGPTGDYLSITAAIADVQAVGNGLGGALVLELQGTYLGTVETFPLTIPALNGASAVNTLTIRPASGATALAISSADTTAATVDLNGAQFVTIDGRPGGVGSNAGSGGGAASQLTIANTSASGVAVRFINEASGNTLRYTTLRGVNASFTSGTVLFSTTTGANGNDNNTIDHCDISDGASTPINCICSAGSTGTTAQNNSGNTVSNCNVFNFHFGGGNAAGVSLVSGSTDWTITGSSFYQTAVRTAVAAEVWAVFVNTGSNMVVTNNFIGGSAPSAGGTAWTTTGTSAAYRFTGIELRVGIHVGDIIIEDDDIFGDGVNIAARLEGIAQPGGICISDDAYRQVRGKVDIGCDDLGMQTLSLPYLSALINTTISSLWPLPDDFNLMVLPFL